MGVRAVGGLFSVALSKDRSFSPCGERPALRSPDFPPDFVWTVRLRRTAAGEDEYQAKLVQAKPGGPLLLFWDYYTTNVMLIIVSRPICA